MNIFQFAIPLKSLTGLVLSKWAAAGSSHIVQTVVDRADLKPGIASFKLNSLERILILDSRVLELGYGRGNGIGAVLQHIDKGELNSFLFSLRSARTLS